MMYSEFITGTGCKENEHNYKVFKNLEIMYMNSDMTKEEIYEYGKKLVDNSKSAEQIAFEEEIKSKIERHEAEIELKESWVKYYTEIGNRSMAMYYRKEIKHHKEELQALKWVLA